MAVPVGGARAALPGHAADTSTDMSTDTAVGRVLAPTDAAPVRVADNDDDDDDDEMGGGPAAPRRTGPAPAQNPLIGAPRATVN